MKCDKCEREFKSEKGLESHHCVPEVVVTITLRIPNIHNPKEGSLSKKMTVGQMKQLQRLADEFNAVNSPLEGSYFEVSS